MLIRLLDLTEVVLQEYHSDESNAVITVATASGSSIKEIRRDEDLVIIRLPVRVKG